MRRAGCGISGARGGGGGSGGATEYDGQTWGGERAWVGEGVVVRVCQQVWQRGTSCATMPAHLYDGRAGDGRSQAGDGEQSLCSSSDGGVDAARASALNLANCRPKRGPRRCATGGGHGGRSVDVGSGSSLAGVSTRRTFFLHIG